MLETGFYVRKPLVVEAVYVTDENQYEVAKWCGGNVISVDGNKVVEVDVLHPSNMHQGHAKPGSWVLRSVQGYKIFNDKAFQRGFDKTTSTDDLPQEVKNALKKMGAAFA